MGWFNCLVWFALVGFFLLFLGMQKTKMAFVYFLAFVMCASTICMAVGIIGINKALVNTNAELRNQGYSLSEIKRNLDGSEVVSKRLISEIKFHTSETEFMTLTTTSAVSWYVTIYSNGFVCVYKNSSLEYYIPQDSILYIKD